LAGLAVFGGGPFYGTGYYGGGGLGLVIVILLILILLGRIWGAPAAAKGLGNLPSGTTFQTGRKFGGSNEEGDHLCVWRCILGNTGARRRLLGRAGFFDQALPGGYREADHDDHNRHWQHRVQDTRRSGRLDKDYKGLHFRLILFTSLLGRLSAAFLFAPLRAPESISSQWQSANCRFDRAWLMALGLTVSPTLLAPADEAIEW
jgi:hypothetical protein